MNVEELNDYCLTKPFTSASCPFGPDTLVFKVFEKIFALTGLDTVQCSLNLKCQPEYAIELRERYPAVTPGYHMNKKMWNTVQVDELMDDILLKHLIDHSYTEVVKGLPKKYREQVETALENGE